MITFDVSDVSAPSVRLTAAGAAEAALRRLVKGRFEAVSSNLPNLVLSPKPRELREEEDEPGLDVATNPFVAAVHAAFAWHFPLVLSPDDVWLCIAQGFGIHVNENAEQLRERFVRHEGKELIRVVRNEFVRGSPENDWSGVFAEFSGAIAEHIGKKRDLVVSSFSTTGPIERAASEIVLMSAMQRYFDYRVTTLCGIPRVTLLGQPEDWRSIRERAAVLAEFDLGWWVDALLPVLDQLVMTSNGSVDQAFWRSIYNTDNESGGPHITGWINLLFPYIMRFDGELDPRGGLSQSIASNRQSFERLKGGPKGGVRMAPMTSNMFPKGLSKAPFIWEYLGTNIPMEFLGGFIGMSQDPETQAVRPAIGWAVREAPAND